MSKIVIIRTPFVFPKNHISSIAAVPDIGTAYINGALQSAGHDSFIIDAAGESLDESFLIENSDLVILGLSAEEIIKRIPEDVDMIGIQSMHSNRWIYDGYITRQIINKFPHAKVFLGGEHVTACADFILNEIPEISACVLGEGEETVVELVHYLELGLPLRDVKGIAYVDQFGKVKFTDKRRRRKDLDQLARPSWTNVPLKEYLDRRCGVNSFARRSITMVATRGCPFSCTFCTVPGMWESKWYARPPLDVIDEIKSYIKEYQVDHIDFVDLTIVINKEWMKEFCTLLIKENLGITWAIPIGTRTENLDEGLLKLMKDSGLTRLLYSAESGSSETLERIKKKLNIANFNMIVRKTVNLDICVKIAFIFGFPGQTLKEVFESFVLINKLAIWGVQDIVCLSFIPYPQTELFDQLNITYDYSTFDKNIQINNDIPNMKSWSDCFGDTALKFFIVFFTLYFYGFYFLLRPKRLLVSFYRIFVTKKAHTNFESIVFNLFKQRGRPAGSVTINKENSDFQTNKLSMLRKEEEFEICK